MQFISGFFPPCATNSPLEAVERFIDTPTNSDHLENPSVLGKYVFYLNVLKNNNSNKTEMF